MKLSSLALVAWMLLGQIAVADDTGSPVPLPPGSHISPAAKNAAEAPGWNPAPSPATPGAAGVSPVPGATAAPINSTPTTAAPHSAAGFAAQPPQMLPPSDDAKPLTPPADANPTADNSTDHPDNSDPTTDQPRPLKSVMIRRAPKTAVPVSAEPASEVAPARYEEPLPPPMQAAPTAPPSASAAPPVTSGIIETPADQEKVAAARAAADLLATSFDARTDGVSPITLLNALAQAGETARPVAIHDYWRLSRAWSDSHWAEDELKRLEAVVPARSSVDSPMLSTARAAAAARLSEAQVGIQAAQDALMRSAHLQIQTDTYRPSDAPLVGPYHTYFAALFANRQPPPGRTLQIDRSLPLRLKAINDRAAAVQSATSAVHYAEEAHAKGEADMRTVLACHEALYHQRRALLDEVLAYNLDIGEYVSTVAAPGTPNEKLVGMLIQTKPADRVSAVPSATSGPPTTSARAATAGVRPSTNDGWVPSTMRSVEPSRSPR